MPLGILLLSPRFRRARPVLAIVVQLLTCCVSSSAQPLASAVPATLPGPAGDNSAPASSRSCPALAVDVERLIAD
jgi:hypothetical protein